MYPEQLVAPMRADLTQVGFQEVRTAEEAQQIMQNQKGTALVVINSVCGCAAGAARPGVKLALQRSKVKPNSLLTAFAGVDKEAVSKIREYTLPYPPSSPAIALFKDGTLVHFVERHQIEGKPAEMIASHLESVFEMYCN
jgi:putative YphP/YqiW family bacilliredoxin